MLLTVRNFLFLIPVLLLLVVFALGREKTSDTGKTSVSVTPKTVLPVHPLQIEEMRNKSYPGSQITIEETLSDGENYHQYIASYKSEGLKIFGLLTVPSSEKPPSGFPVIIFNHGYIPPEQYRTTQRYEAYVDSFARSGYVVFKPDYRGNGSSEGKPLGAYFSPTYTVDVLNALSSVKQLPYVNREKIGMWGHSLGGHITLRSMVVSRNIKAGVIWGGVVASYEDMLEHWRRRTPFRPSERENLSRRPSRESILKAFGDPGKNPLFWQSISPIYFVGDISGPVQLHHGLADEEVPWEFSESLQKKLEKAGKTVEFYTYPGGDHNLSGESFSIAMQRSLAFFDKYLK